MKLNSTNLILTILLIINFQNVYSYSNCTSSTTTIGCLICDDPTTQSYAFNQTELKYTCTGTLNCTIVAGNICISCAAPFTIDAITNLCIQIQGCIFVQDGACLACEPLNFVLINGNCYQKQIDYCTQYTLFNNNLGCLTCTYIEMDPVQNCTFSSTVCQQFDYQLMKCKKCPTGTIIHSDGRSCYSPIPDCQVYSSSSTPQCLICKTNYVLNTSSLTCILGQSNGIMSQVLSYNLINASPSYTYLCLDNLLAFNQSTFDCTTAANEHCAIRNSTGTLCLQCIPGYFLRSNDSLCRQCSVLISNCALCSNQTVCTTCLYGYYLQNTTSTSSVCMPCSSFGCLDCSSDFDANGKVRCISCPANKTLFSGSCIACQDSLSSFSVSQSKCLPCNNITNCISCIFPANSTDIAQLICLECSYQNYYNSVNLACQLIQAATNVTFDSAYEILRKVAPGSDSVFYPDGSTLMSSCNSTDGFICICNSKNLTSLCKNFTLIPNISALVFSTNQIIAQYPDQLRMAAELPSFNLQTHLTVATYEPLTLYQFWSLLSAITLTILRDQQNGISINSAAVARIFNHATAMINVFSDQKITILRGNGFYFKFIPKGLISGSTGDDTYIKTNLPSTGYVIIFIHYPRLDALSNGSLTGTTYVLTDNTQATFDVTVRKTRYSSITSTYKSRIEGSPTNNNVTLNSGQILINQFPKSTAVLPQGVQIYGLAADSTSDIYASQRIENIFYSQSWLYILFFILLYLIFIPLCAIVDCCETQQTSRKKVGSEQPSDNKEQSDENIVRINYRDFFPVYNVGNTPRPLRLSKLCLFIVNMQHIISFLTIIYVNLPGSLPVAAIALVIPAYLCTVIMGYICGALFRNLPGRLKWLINLFSLGYWILWIFVMRDMSIKPSKEYRLFILVFSILSFFLDLTIDALQTLLVYFSIKQGEKQVSLFQCLAKWLSLRGFYQFDKLAKQIEYQQ